MNSTFYPPSHVSLGDITVHTTSGRGWTPEEIAERALDKILYVSETAPDPIRQQAVAYRDSVRAVLVHYLQEAVRSDRTTISNRLIGAGHPELVHILKG
jgi:hypothetical protein